MENLSHLSSLHTLRSSAKSQRNRARAPQKKAWLAMLIGQLDREISSEVKYLAQHGIAVPDWLGADCDLCEMSDDELAAELSA